MSTRYRRLLPGRLRALNELRGVGEAALFARISAFAITVPLLLRLPLPRVAALLARTRRRTAASWEEVERIAALVALGPRVAHPLIRRGCLTRGLTLFWSLRQAGIGVELCFGLDPGATDDADGHCWLALDGEPFLEQPDPRPRFTEIMRLPAAKA